MDAAELAGDEGVREADVAAAAATNGQRAARERHMRVLLGEQSKSEYST